MLQNASKIKQSNYSRSVDQTSPIGSTYGMLSYVMTAFQETNTIESHLKFQVLWLVCVMSLVNNRFISRWASMHPINFSCLLSGPIKHVTILTRNHLSSRALCTHHFHTAVKTLFHRTFGRNKMQWCAVKSWRGMWKKVMPEWNVWHRVC